MSVIRGTTLSDEAPRAPHRRFDAIARRFSTGRPSRRAVAGGLAAAALGLVAGGLGRGTADAEQRAHCAHLGQACGHGTRCCVNTEATCRNGRCSCPAGRKRCRHACIPKATCCTNADCGTDQVCAFGICQLTTCASPQEIDSTTPTPCGPAGNGCFCVTTVEGSSICTNTGVACNGCTSDADCAAGQACVTPCTGCPGNGNSCVVGCPAA